MSVINWGCLKLIGEFKAPYKLLASSNKPFYVNLNCYHSAHRLKYAKAKKNFYELVKGYYKQPKGSYQIFISYQFYPPRNGLRDVNNSVAMCDKFFTDYLVLKKFISDDNFKIIPYAPHGQVMSKAKNDGYFYIKVFKIIVDN